MPRPRTKSDAIPIRLSLAAHAEAVRRAEAKGLPVRQWLEEAMEAALTPKPGTATAPPDVTPIPKGKP
jgi:predicted HicB family RNase H-like nuclease